jgi:hypothetical protein
MRVSTNGRNLLWAPKSILTEGMEMEPWFWFGETV